MSGQSSTTSVIIPVSLVAVCFLLLVNIWTSKTNNQALSEDVGRAVADVDMEQYQSEFCLSQVKQKFKIKKIKINHTQGPIFRFILGFFGKYWKEVS